MPINATHVAVARGDMRLKLLNLSLIVNLVEWV